MQTIIDPNEARRFAGFLQETSRELRSRNAAVNRSLMELNATWRDSKYDSFEKLFEEATLQLERFLEHSEKYAEYLRRKAAIVDRYLDRR